MVRRADFEEDREALLAAMDQPTIDGVNSWFVARAAASQGIKVSLSGVGGDELFASYPSFAELPHVNSLVRPFSFVPGLGKTFRHMSARFMSRHTSPKYAGLFEYGGNLAGAYLLRRGLFMPWELPNVMDPELACQGLQELRTIEQLNKIVDNSLGSANCTRLQVSALEMTWYMRNQLLCDTDWASMAHSLEIRVPFVDVVLLKTISPWLAAYPALTKAEIATAVAPQLPNNLLSKPKTGFSIPTRDWLLNDLSINKERGLRSWAKFVMKSFGKETS
jgi:asparagine synthase (glutamine-hydrolysing)